MSQKPSSDHVLKTESFFREFNNSYPDRIGGGKKSIILNSNAIGKTILKIKESLSYKPNFYFTIVTVNYNHGEGLNNTIRSVLKQKYTDFQYIVIDGASADNSKQIISEYLSYIDIAVFEQDKGVYNAMNKGIDLSLGKYILFLNSGDCFADNEVLAKVAEASHLNDAEIIYGNTRLQVNQKIWPANRNPLDIWKGMVCSHQSIFIDYKLASRYRFDENQKIVADWHMIMSCILDEKRCTKVLDFPISQIEPVGISSDFTTRTLERWNLIRKKYSNDKGRLQEIDEYYFALLNKEFSIPASTSDSNRIDAKKIDPNLIFLISMPRSGSTLLQRILESCEEIGSCGESWVALPPLAASNIEITESKYDVQLSNYAFAEASKELSLNNSTLKNAQYEYLKSIYSEILSKLNTKYFLDKTPRYVHIVQELHELFPDAKFIVLTRQPTAIINSYTSTWCKKDYNLLSCHPSHSFDLTHGLSKLIKFIQLNNSNVCTISYESLCKNPEGTCARLTKFLGFVVNPEINQSPKALNRSLGDPKQINSSKGINLRSVEHLGKRQDYKNLDAYDLICSKIPAFVWNYFSTSKPICEAKRAAISNSYFSVPANNPSHTIIITCFNNQATIVSALDSAVNQIRKPNQIIIIDDKSIDNSVPIVNDYISRCDVPIEIKLIQNIKNLGVSSSRHKAITSSSSDFISTLDGDDTISPSKIDMEMKAIARTGSQVAFSDIKLMTQSNIRILNTRGYHQKSVQSILNSLLSRSSPVPRDLTFSRNIYDKTGGFEPSFNLFEDWMLKQRLAVFSGETSWAHSGVIGTNYDRRNPGLSNKNKIQLCYAQLLVLSKNICFFEGHDINFGAVVTMLLRSCPELEHIFTRLDKVNSDSKGYDKYIFNLFCEIKNSMNELPSYLAEPDVITKALSEF